MKRFTYGVVRVTDVPNYKRVFTPAPGRQGANATQWALLRSDQKILWTWDSHVGIFGTYEPDDDDNDVQNSCALDDKKAFENGRRLRRFAGETAECWAHTGAEASVLLAPYQVRRKRFSLRQLRDVLARECAFADEDFNDLDSLDEHCAKTSARLVMRRGRPYIEVTWPILPDKDMCP